MNHASNYLTLKGTLNQDRDAMLERVRKGLEGATACDRVLACSVSAASKEL